MSRVRSFRLLLAAAVAIIFPLLATAATERVHVIVAVVAPSNAARSSLIVSDAVKSMRASVVESLHEATEVEPWGNSSAFSAEIDRADFDKLANDPRVRAIAIDDGGQAALMESVPLVGADKVHAQGYDGHGVTVAVLDSGIDANSPDFAGRIVAQQCFCDNLDGTGCCPNGESVQSGIDAARDDNGHGTHVSGIVAGSGASAPKGIAPGARLVAVKVLDYNRTFRSFTQIYRALEWIANERPDVKVINMSFGSWAILEPTECDSSAISLGMHDIVAELRNRGVLIVASSGNQSSLTGTTIPSCMTDILGVGATYDAPGGKQSSCEQSITHLDDVTCFTNSSHAIDLLAPGAVITAAKRGGGFVTMSGTSMAAPHVAGALALMHQVSAGTLSAAQAESILKSTGHTIVDPRNGLSFPRLDVAAAIAATPHVPTPPAPKRRAAKK